MKSCAVTGSISRRRRSCVYPWIRASSRRAQNSSLPAPGGIEAPAHREAFRLEPGEGGAEPPSRRAPSRRQLGDGARPAARQVAAHRVVARLLLVGRRRRAPAGTRDVGLEARARKQRRHARPLLGGAPERPVRRAHRCGAPGLGRARRTSPCQAARGAGRPARAGDRAARRRRGGRAAPPRGPARSPRGRAARDRAPLGQPAPQRTARVRRSSSGASSRKVYGRLFRISWASGEGSVVSRKTGADGSAPDAVEQPLEPVDVHRFVQTVVQRLAHEQVVGDLARPGARCPGSRRAPGTRRPSGRPPPCAGSAAGSAARALPQHHERAVEVPAPAHPEHRRQEQRLREDLVGVLGRRKLRHLVERKAVLRAEREHDRVVAGRGLELEVERRQKRLRSAARARG